MNAPSATSDIPPLETASKPDVEPAPDIRETVVISKHELSIQDTVEIPVEKVKKVLTRQQLDLLQKARQVFSASKGNKMLKQTPDGWMYDPRKSPDQQLIMVADIDEIVTDAEIEKPVIRMLKQLRNHILADVESVTRLIDTQSSDGNAALEDLRKEKERFMSTVKPRETVQDRVIGFVRRLNPFGK